MAYRSLAHLVLLSSLLSALIPNEAASSSVDTWQQLDPKDPKVVAIANFAVEEHNFLAKTALKFINVVNAEEKGDVNKLVIDYQLVIFASEGGATNSPKNYLAVLKSTRVDEFLKLVSFEPVHN